MTVIGEAFIAIKPEGSQFTSQTEQVVVGGLKSVAAKAATIIGGAIVGRAFLSAAKEGIDELKQQQAAAAQTALAIASTGGAANVTVGHVSELSKSLEHLTGTDDEVIQGAENMILRFRGIQNTLGQGNDIFDRTTKAALDLSQVFGTDVTTSAKTLAIALDNPEQGMLKLRRAGIILTDSQKQLITGFVESGKTADAQKVILDAVEQKVKGAAAAYGKTLPGQIDIAKQSLADAKGNLVGVFAPALTIAATATSFLAQKVEELPKPLAATVGGVVAAGAAFVSLVRPIQAGVDLFDRFSKTSKLVADATQAGTVATEAATVAAGDNAAALAAQTVSVQAATAASSELDAATISRVTSNASIVFSDAEVAAAVQARTLAEYQALVGNDALIASDAELVAADQAVAVAQAEVAAAQRAAAFATASSYAASVPLAALLGVTTLGLGALVVATQTVGKAYKVTTADLSDFTAAVKADGGELKNHTAVALADLVSTKQATDDLAKAGISVHDLTLALGDNVGAYNQAIDKIEAYRNSNNDGYEVATRLNKLLVGGKQILLDNAGAADTNAEALSQVTGALGDEGDALASVTQEQINHDAAVATANALSGLQATAVGGVTKQLDLQQAALERAKQAELDRLGAIQSAAEGEIQHSQAVDATRVALDAASKAVDDNKTATNEQTVAADAAKQAIIDQGNAAVTWYEAASGKAADATTAAALQKAEYENIAKTLSPDSDLYKWLQGYITKLDELDNRTVDVTILQQFKVTGTGGSGFVPGGGIQSHGGIYHASSPTAAIYGDMGGETAIFIPDNPAMRTGPGLGAALTGAVQQQVTPQMVDLGGTAGGGWSGDLVVMVDPSKIGVANARVFGQAVGAAVLDEFAKRRLGASIGGI